jgi:tetratricopeptide (TPR) repeat protein
MRSGRTSRWQLAWGPALVVLLASPCAHAEPTRTPSAQKSNEDRAAALYDKSADAYKRGDFKTAVDLLKEAYGLDPQPVLLYNLARAYEGLGDLDAAIDGYERYLAQNPKTEDKGAIEQRLVTLKRLRDDRNAAAKQHEEDQKKKSAPPPPTSPPPAPTHTIYPYIVAGAGGVGLVLGSVFGLMALSHRSDARSEPTQQRAIDLDNQAQSLATVSTISFIAGSVLVAGGVAWWVLEEKGMTGSASPSVRVGIAPGFVGATGTLP